MINKRRKTKKDLNSNDRQKQNWVTNILYKDLILQAEVLTQTTPLQPSDLLQINQPLVSCLVYVSWMPYSPTYSSTWRIHNICIWIYIYIYRCNPTMPSLRAGRKLKGFLLHSFHLLHYICSSCFTRLCMGAR